jgi:hypothetical protein
MCCFGGFNELGSVPFSAVVVSTAASSAITARDKLSQVPVPAATRLPHGSYVIAVEHMLHCINTKKAIVVGAVVAVKMVIRIFEMQKGHVCLGASPSNF